MIVLLFVARDQFYEGRKILYKVIKTEVLLIFGEGSV